MLTLTLVILLSRSKKIQRNLFRFVKITPLALQY